MTKSEIGGETTVANDDWEAGSGAVGSGVEVSQGVGVAVEVRTEDGTVAGGGGAGGCGVPVRILVGTVCPFGD
jgi:hypothetical protein